MLTITDKWKSTYPGASVGILVMNGVTNPTSHPELDIVKAEVEANLRAQFGHLDRAGLRETSTLKAYHTYYKIFKKTYHVQLQLESIIHKGRSIPSVAALVEAMFTAELKNQLLTAGHDLDIVQQPIGVYAAEGDETFMRLNGQEQQLKASDMYIADSQGILSSVIYGPDRRTAISPRTPRALFTIYAPPGIETFVVQSHLQDIETYARMITPEATTDVLEIYSA